MSPSTTRSPQLRIVNRCTCAWVTAGARPAWMTGHCTGVPVSTRVSHTATPRDASHSQCSSTTAAYQDGAGEPQPAAPRGRREQCGAHDRGPQPVPERCQDAAQQLGLHQVRQREPGGGEQCVEGVAGALEGGEPEADRGAQDDAVPHGVAGQPAREQPQHHQLHGLLDQPDADVGQAGGLPEERRFQEGCTQHTEQASVDERREDALGGDDLVSAPEGVGDEGDRDEEAADQDDRRDQVGVPGHEGDHHGCHPQPEAAGEHPPPARPGPRTLHGRAGTEGRLRVGGRLRWHRLGSSGMTSLRHHHDPVLPMRAR